MPDKNRVILYCDRTMAACLCLLFFCMPFAKAGVETFTWLAIFLWVFKRVLGYRSETFWGIFHKTTLNVSLAVYMLANAASIIFCSKLSLFFRGLFGKELKFLLIYFIIAEVISNKKRLLSILITVIASAVLITADAAVQYYTGKDFLRGNYFQTFSASFFSGSAFAGWLIIIIPALLGILSVKVIANIKLKIFLFIITGINFLFLLLTYCRGAWVGFATAGLFVLFYFNKIILVRNKILFLTTGACLLILLLFLPKLIEPQTKYEILTKFKFGQNINSRLKSILKQDSSSVLERMRLWKEAIRMIRDYPVTGCGLNNYSIVARRYKSFEGGGVYPHNSFLQKTAETGIFGLLSFLFVLFNFSKMGILYLNKHKNYLVLGLLAGILAFLVQAFFDTHLYSLQLVVLFWYMLGLTVAVIKLDSQNKIDSFISG